MGRYALLVGISNYNVDLNPLPSAVKDVDALLQVLLNPEIGGFAESDVVVLKDEGKGTIETAIYCLFTNRKPDDLLLFYFSGHGVTDDRRNFYFTGISTSKDALPPTAVSSVYIHSEMDNSRSQRQVLILDCCHSGAFPKGMKAKGTVDIKLGGEGRAILTAADSSQYAFEQEGYNLSLYTHFLVEGLKTGAADLDEDGHVSVDELHQYVERRVKSVNNSISPKFFGQKEGHRIVLARAGQKAHKLKFRKEVEKCVNRRDGVISSVGRKLLNVKSQGIDSLEVEAIINEVLHEHQEYAQKTKEYETALIEMSAEEFPFSEVTHEELREYADCLGLHDEDLQHIKHRVINRMTSPTDDLQKITSQVSQTRLETRHKETELQKISIVRERLLVDEMKESLEQLSQTKFPQTEHVSCFFAMSFDPSYDPLLKAVRQVLEDKPYGWQVIRADEGYQRMTISENVGEHIARSHCYLADISDRNPNVFLEIGKMSFYKERPLIYLCRQDQTENIAVDLAGSLYFTYSLWDRTEPNIEALAEQIRGLIANRNDLRQLRNGKKTYLSADLLVRKGEVAANVARTIAEHYQTVEDFLAQDTIAIADKLQITRHGAIMDAQDFLQRYYGL